MHKYSVLKILWLFSFKSDEKDILPYSHLKIIVPLSCLSASAPSLSLSLCFHFPGWNDGWGSVIMFIIMHTRHFAFQEMQERLKPMRRAETIWSEGVKTWNKKQPCCPGSVCVVHACMFAYLCILVYDRVQIFDLTNHADRKKNPFQWKNIMVRSCRYIDSRALMVYNQNKWRYSETAMRSSSSALQNNRFW